MNIIKTTWFSSYITPIQPCAHRPFSSLAFTGREYQEVGGLGPLICSTSLIHIIMNSIQPLRGLCHS